MSKLEINRKMMRRLFKDFTVVAQSGGKAMNPQRFCSGLLEAMGLKVDCSNPDTVMEQLSAECKKKGVDVELTEATEAVKRCIGDGSQITDIPTFCDAASDVFDALGQPAMADSLAMASSFAMSKAAEFGGAHETNDK